MSNRPDDRSAFLHPPSDVHHPPRRNRSSDQPTEAMLESRWYVIWTYKHLDPIDKLALLVIAVAVIAFAIDGQLIAVAMLGAFLLGALLVLFAFTTHHFRMTTGDTRDRA